MRVLEAFGEPISHGGQESFVMNVVQNMNLNGLQIDFLTPYYCDNEEYRKKISSLGGKIFELKKEFRPGKSRLYLRGAINKFFQQNEYDVVHVHSGSTSMLAIYAYYAKKYGVKKVIVHSHASAEKITLRGRVLRQFCGFYMENNVDKYCACSKLAGEAKFLPDREICIVKNGIDLVKFSFDRKKRLETRKKLGISDNTFVVGHVGRFCYEKNHEFLLEIFKALLNINSNTLLLSIGTGELEQLVKDKAKEMGISKQIKFIGVVNNVNDYMQAMDCFVFPSRFEGLGMVAIEAQTMSLPCFLSDVIPKEVAITDLVHFISLNRSPQEWAKIIAKDGLKFRNNMRDIIINAGYDIKETSKIIRHLYLY